MQGSSATQPTWYGLTAEAVAGKLQVDPAKGLSAAEAQQRRERYGRNKLAAKRKEPGWQAFLRQYKDFMQIILVAAAAISAILIRDWGTTFALLVLTVFNAVLSLRQESKAEASLAALEKMMKNIARVRRDGQAIEVDAEELVPGDIVLFEAGNLVPADGRLFVAANLEIEEAALTGESVASPKSTEAIAKPEVPLGDRHCMAYMNTSATRGRGEMIVTTIGMGTEMGHIADLLNKTKADKTPLQKQLDRLTLIIAGIALLAMIVMIALGLYRQQEFDVLFRAAIALAISAIPTGLPAIVTTMYSTGTQVLAGQNAIVKRLPSVETLGSVSAICSDKTGTLTLNKMTAREFTIPGANRYTITGEGYSTQGQLLHAGGTKIDLDAVLLPMALCADARIDGENLIGDPTEGALIVLAEKGGIHVDSARAMYPRVADVPSDLDYKFMATFHNMTDDDGKPVVRCFVKGAPDVLIKRSSAIWMPPGQVRKATGDPRQLGMQENDRMAQAGERVMVVARRDFDPETFDPKGHLIDQVNDLTFLAMVGIVDPPRPEAKVAIAQCKSAGIQVRMITGDHAVTAAAIGAELGIHGTAQSGAEFAAKSDEELLKELPDIGVVARVAPEDKIRLVHLLQEKADVVAMTGDGVNDAPALKKADIGVAMGITGTEVSKEAAVMILTDDNFATIVRAVEYGRAIYQNLFKYIRYQMANLVAFVAVFLGAAIFNIAGGVPFSTIMILWLNFAITVPIAMALGFEKPATDLMEHKPRPLHQPVLSSSQWLRIVFLGIVIAVGTLFLEARYQAQGELVYWTMGASVFSLYCVFAGLIVRDETRTALNLEIFGDRHQLRLYGLVLLLTFLATEMNFLQKALGTTPLTGVQWLICIAMSFSLVIADEVIKFLMRRSRSRQTA